MPLMKNQVHTASIQGYTAQGAGVAHIDGMAVFVPGTARGDLCRIRLVKVLKHYAFGRLEEVLQPSPHRIPSDCPAFPKCGGCGFRHITYEEELWQKRRRVWDAMKRIGGFDLPEPEITGSPQQQGYRNKAQFPVGTADGRPAWGFYRSRSHDLIPLESCAIQDPRACAAAKAVCDWADAHQVRPYDEATGKGLLRHIYARTGRAGLHLALVVTKDAIPAADDLLARVQAACPDLCGLVLNINVRRDNVILGDACRTLWGADRLEDDLMGAAFRLSPLSFYQVNHAQTQQLYAHAIQQARLTPDTVALDLYCGIGTITLALAKQCKTVIGAEIVPAAIEDAKENAARNGITNARFFCGDAGQTAEHLAKEGFSPDVILCDPPRKGMDETAIAAILRMNPKRIVYVSCECETLARDAKLLCAGGYTLTHVHAFDMFPRTAHVESVVCLTRHNELPLA